MFNYDVWAFVHFKLERKITADSKFVILLLFKYFEKFNIQIYFYDIVYFE